MMVTNTKEKDKTFSSDSTKTYVKKHTDNNIQCVGLQFTPALEKFERKKNRAARAKRGNYTIHVKETI